MRAASDRVVPGQRATGEIVLPNGRLLTPTGAQTAVLSSPFALALTPDGRRLVVASTGPAEQALQVLDARDGRLLSSTPVEKAWLGLAIAPDGRTVYMSGANSHRIVTFRLEGDRLTRDADLPVAQAGEKNAGVLPAGIALSPDGKSLWVARIQSDDLVSIDLATRAVTRIVAVGRHPYRPVFSPDGKTLAVANWGGASISIVDTGTGTVVETIPTADHPCDLVFATASRLYVAQANRNWVGAVDLTAKRVVRQISVAMGPEGPGTPSAESLPDGSTPNALALSRDGKTLYAASADDDVVAVIELGSLRTTGFIPTGWYPAAVATSQDGKTLFVANAKGSGSFSNAKTGPDPTKRDLHAPGSIRMLAGSVSRISLPAKAELGRLTLRAYANRKPVARGVSPAKVSKVVPSSPDVPSPIRHVIYIIRENRTYDQVLGDLPAGNGDPSITIFGRDVTPNAHALADEFVLFDNFYADAEVSADGHSWSMAAYATDFTEKTWPVNYGGRGFGYLWEGDDPTAAPTAGYLWDVAARAGLTLRNYGEFTGGSPDKPPPFFDGVFEGKVANLKGNTCPFFPGYDNDILDNARVDVWLKEFREYVAKGDLPRLMIVRLGTDHTLGTKSGARTPRAMVADNDLAMGRLVEAVSSSRFWKETAIFAVEDDAQNGSDHVDAHRTIAFAVSPYTRRGGFVDSTLYSTSSMLRTMEMILGLPPLSQHDAAATPMTNAFRDDPDLTPFRHRPVTIPLYEMNPHGAPMQALADTWDLSREDAAPEIALNEAIWKSVKGKDAVMPPPVNAAFVRALD